jgi:hypothetical protein
MIFHNKFTKRVNISPKNVEDVFTQICCVDSWDVSTKCKHSDTISKGVWSFRIFYTLKLSVSAIKSLHARNFLRKQKECAIYRLKAAIKTSAMAQKMA